MKITLVVMGNPPRELQLTEGATVEDAIAAANLSPEIEVRIRGEKADAAQTLSDGELLVGTQPVKGGIA
jgi:putative ubiquitin-RnfH superfamily antitoxin RatB of RatAB toxin-antitoxin module